jgi:hypothetical protein
LTRVILSLFAPFQLLCAESPADHGLSGDFGVMKHGGGIQQSPFGEIASDESGGFGVSRASYEILASSQVV